jgi:hypothetical protein
MVSSVTGVAPVSDATCGVGAVNATAPDMTLSPARETTP